MLTQQLDYKTVLYRFLKKTHLEDKRKIGKQVAYITVRSINLSKHRNLSKSV
jgi:hypothetical protein